MQGIRKTETKQKRRYLFPSKIRRLQEILNRERLLLRSKYRNAKKHLLDNSNLELAYLGKIQNLKDDLKKNRLEYSTTALRKGGKISANILLNKRLDILSTRNSNKIRNAVLDADPEGYAENLIRESERYGNTKFYQLSKATEKKINERLTPRREAFVKRLGTRLDKAAEEYAEGLRIVLRPHTSKRKRYPEIEDL